MSEMVDDRSEKNIVTLHPSLQPVVRQFIFTLVANGITAKVISGTRSYAEQDALYAQGRNKSGRIVTNARGGYSNHNFGIAFDIGIFKDGNYLDDSPLYAKASTFGKELGLEWGGDWKTIQDEPHYQLRPRWATGWSEGNILAQLRERIARGQDVLA